MRCKIRELRERAGISLGQLAKQAGITKSELSLIERNLRIPRISTLFKLREILGVSVDEMYK